MTSFYTKFEHHFLFPNNIASIEKQEFYNPNVEKDEPPYAAKYVAKTPVFNDKVPAEIKEDVTTINSKAGVTNYKNDAPNLAANLPAAELVAKEAPIKVQSQKQKEQPNQYFTLEQLAKIPGTKAVSTLYNSTLPKYRANLNNKDDSDAYFVELEDCGKKIFVYAAREELFESILKNPKDYASIAQNIVELIKKTEDKALTDILEKIATQDIVWITIEDLFKLPDTRKYDVLSKILNYRHEKKPQSTAFAAQEYKLAKDLIRPLFKNKCIAEFIIEAFVEKETRKVQVIPAKTSLQEDSLNNPTAKQIEAFKKINPFDPRYVPKAPEPELQQKKQSRKDKQEAEKEEIRQYIVTKVMGAGLSKIGSNRTDITNLPKGLPSHQKGLAKEVIDEWCRKDILLTKRKNTMTQVSFNPDKLIEIQKYVK